VEASLFLILLPDEHWLLTTTVLVRTALLLLVMVEFLGQIWPTPQIAGQMRRLGARLGWGVMAVTLVVALLGAPRVSQAYTARRLAEHPCRAAIALLQSQAGGITDLIVSDQIEIWRDFYPWLRNDYTIRIVDGYDPQDRPWPQMVAERLAAVVGSAEFWWLERPDPPSQAGDFFAQPAVQLLEEEHFGPCTLKRVIRLSEPPLATAQSPPGIQLRWAQLGNGQVGADLALVLYWQTATPVAERYTVFTQLLNASGQIVAQQDNEPAQGQAPTTTWQPGSLIRDPYRLALPADLPPGPYRLIVGLYNDAGRVAWQLPDGSTADHIGFDISLVQEQGNR
jgi:hypothetical protein